MLVEDSLIKNLIPAYFSANDCLQIPEETRCFYEIKNIWDLL